MNKIPIIDVTDLYHPYQDCGDNFDLVAAYALPEVELRAVILDVTERFRQRSTQAGFYSDASGPRDPGFIPVTQLNYIFGRRVPVAAGPFYQMRSGTDPMIDGPRFGQAGVELILETLRDSAEPVDILCFSSARAIAAAWNRQPELLRQKVRRLHLSAGAAPGGYLEWNVALDPYAFARLLRSDLPIALYPCATSEGPFSYGQHNTYWNLPNLEFIRGMEPRLRRYLGFAFGRIARMDFLRAMDEDLPAEIMEGMYKTEHRVWETAIWQTLTGRRLVKCQEGFRLMPVPEAGRNPGLPSDLRPVHLNVRDDGDFDFTFTRSPTSCYLYDRGDARANEAALREALPALYQGFTP